MSISTNPNPRRSKLTRPLRVQREYLSQKEAAEFCGFCERKFRDLAHEYDIPRFGPGKIRYKREVLEQFMACPELFHDPIRERRPGFVPVEVRP
ncbi:MAG: helix-turn-helix domain-containing protein [Pigmentiphaga sp.]